MSDSILGGAYVRKNVYDATMPPIQGASSAQAHEIWDLLKTPHTAKSLCRALAASRDARVELAEMTRLLDDLHNRELIEVSPDS